MKLSLTMAAGVVTAGLLCATAIAQQPPGQPPGQPAGQTPSQPATEPITQPKSGMKAEEAGQITLIGCIQREADYRKAQDKGRGGVAGTGVGVDDEFVLLNASMATQGVKSDATTTDTAYELTGTNEEKVKDFVGKRVQIMGKLKAAETTATGAPTGGATAGTPPRGVDVASKDLKLRELEIISVTAATGTCPTP